MEDIVASVCIYLYRQTNTYNQAVHSTVPTKMTNNDKLF